MKKTIKFLSAMMVALTCSFVFFSFTGNKGGEAFEIYLNNKLLSQLHGNNLNNVASLSLQNASYNDELKVRYFHCGRIGKGRTIVIKNEHDQLLKQWTFENASQPASFMVCKVKDIISLRKNRTGWLKLYYSSSELPNGRLLARISTDKKDMTSK